MLLLYQHITENCHKLKYYVLQGSVLYSTKQFLLFNDCLKILFHIIWPHYTFPTMIDSSQIGPRRGNFRGESWRRGEGRKGWDVQTAKKYDFNDILSVFFIII